MGLLGTSWALPSFPLAGDDNGGGLSGEMSITEYGLTLGRDPGFPIGQKNRHIMYNSHPLSGSSWRRSTILPCVSAPSGGRGSSLYAPS